MNVYEKYTKVVEAEFPRWNLHSTIPSGVSLSVVFDHYRLRRNLLNLDKVQVNLYFLSGTGMTKSIWRYYIKKFFELNNEEVNWQIANCIAIDLVNHGESAIENEGKLGWEFDWREGSHDLLQVAKSLRLPGENVVIGHSMGGFQSLYSTTIAPLLFKFVIAIEPVLHSSELGTFVFQTKLLPSLNKAIRSEFKNEEDFYTYFKKYSFYRKFHPEILNDFIESEKLINKDGTVSAKTSKQQQMICYYQGEKIFKASLSILKHIPIPVIHVIGGNATWTEKESNKVVDEVIPDVEVITVPNGEHLVNGEDPDAIFEIIVNGLHKHIGKQPNEEKPGIYSKQKYESTFEENYSKLEQQFFVRKNKL